MKSEPLLLLGGAAILLVVLCAVLLNVTHTPITMLTAVAAAIVPIVGVVLAGRSQVLSTQTAETVVTDALVKSTPTNPAACAKEMVKEAK